MAGTTPISLRSGMAARSALAHRANMSGGLAHHAPPGATFGGHLSVLEPTEQTGKNAKAAKGVPMFGNLDNVKLFARDNAQQSQAKHL